MASPAVAPRRKILLGWSNPPTRQDITRMIQIVTVVLGGESTIKTLKIKGYFSVDPKTAIFAEAEILDTQNLSLSLKICFERLNGERKWVGRPVGDHEIPKNSPYSPNELWSSLNLNLGPGP